MFISITEKTVILVVGANYDETSILWISKEYQKIQDAINGSRNSQIFDVRDCPHLKREDLNENLSRYKPQIIHFVGHCDSEAGFLFSGDNDHPTSEYFDQLVDDLKIYQHLINLIVFNGCNSQRIARAVGNFIPNTIGTNESIADPRATIFANAFYKSLGNGGSYFSSFQNGVRAYMRDYPLGRENHYAFFENSSNKLEAIVRYTSSGFLKLIDEEQIQFPRGKSLLYTITINAPFQFKINPSDENNKLFLVNCIVNISQILQLVSNGFFSLLQTLTPKLNEESLVNYLKSKINFLCFTARISISSCNDRQLSITAFIYPTIMHPDYTYEICEMPLIQTYDDFIKLVLLK